MQTTAIIPFNHYVSPLTFEKHVQSWAGQNKSFEQLTKELEDFAAKCVKNVVKNRSKFRGRWT